MQRDYHVPQFQTYSPHYLLSVAGSRRLAASSTMQAGRGHDQRKVAEATCAEVASSLLPALD